MSFSNNSLLIVGSSLMIVFCGVFIKKLARGRKLSPDQEWEDWFLGTELIFSAITSALFKALEAAGFKQGQPLPAVSLPPPVISPEKIQLYILFTIWSIIALIIIMFIHQRGIDWNYRRRTQALGILASVLGLMVVMGLQFI
jgi:hypothetical protein